MKMNLIILVLLIPAIVIAQPKPGEFAFYGGPQVSAAVGKDLTAAHSVGIGLHTQALYGLNSNWSVGGRLTYTYLFGKKTTTYHYEPPGGGDPGSEHKHNGMSGLGITAGTRYSTPGDFYFGFDIGACLDFLEGDNQLAGILLAEAGYELNNIHALSLFFLICGDPKMQVGARYSIRLGR